MHRVAVQHARLADSEVGDIDHLLNFADTFSLDLAHFERDETAERITMLTQRISDQSNGVTAYRRWNFAPLKE